MTTPEIVAELEDVHAALCEALEIVSRIETTADMIALASILKGARDTAAETIQRTLEEPTP